MATIMGDSVRVLVAINASGEQEGTPGDYDCFKILRGSGFNFNHGQGVESPSETATVDILDFISGGETFSINFEKLLSYSYGEKLRELAMCEDISTTGASVPYSHENELAQALKYGQIAVEYDDSDGTLHRLDFPDSVVTAYSVTSTPEGEAKEIVSVFSKKPTHSTPGSLATVQTTEVVMWDDLIAMMNGVETRCGDMSINLSQPVNEGDFMHGADATEQDFIGRSDQRVIEWDAELLLTPDLAATLLDDRATEWDGENSFTFNNGASSTDEREIKFTLGVSRMTDAPWTVGEFGRVRAGVSFRAKHSSATSALNVVAKNARVTIPA